MKVKMIRGARGDENKQLEVGKTYDVSDKLGGLLIYSQKAISAEKAKKEKSDDDK